MRIGNKVINVSTAIALSVAAGLALAFATAAKAADFAVGTGDGRAFIKVSGDIEMLDGLKLKSLAAAMNKNKKYKGLKVVVALESGGGSVIGGLGVAAIVLVNGWSTYVPPKTVCASACADIWLAGAEKFATKTSKIGMYSAGHKVKGEVVRVDEGNLLRIKYFVNLGLGKDAIVAMLTPDPDGMMWLTADKAKILGINYTTM
jgi:hypothetical protein